MAKSLLEVARYADAPQIVPSEGQNSPGVFGVPINQVYSRSYLQDVIIPDLYRVRNLDT